MDRDIHAAQNMVWFYENNVGVERTKVKRMEMKALVDQALAKENQLLSAKYEDSSLQAGISSLMSKLIMKIFTVANLEFFHKSNPFQSILYKDVELVTDIIEYKGGL